MSNFSTPPEKIDDSTRIDITEAGVRAIGATRYDLTPERRAVVEGLQDQGLERDRDGDRERG